VTDQNRPGRAQPFRVLLAGGGTAGHVYPGLSVAAALRELRHGVEVLYAGTGDAQEARIVHGAGLRYTSVRAAGLRARSPARAAKGLATLAFGTFQSLRLIGRVRPRAVFATGGYGSVPLALAAAARRVPLVVFLPDVYPGWAVRFIAKLATRVATSSEAALEFLPAEKSTVTGYPVRPAFLATNRVTGKERLGMTGRQPVLLVTGGSSGALRLNAALARHLPQFTTLAHVIHLTGRQDYERMAALREKLTPAQQERYHVHAYLDDMPAALAAADPVMGLPAVLVPLELSDQARNARFLESQGAAVVLSGEDAPARLYATVDMILKDPARLTAMRRAMTALARPDAARDLARLVLEVAG
jgi:UDP-N-acetylglucosamine--N-acetylmuramyl-(pentapeptide) pyrophosphoryl-undecaprenol N-acetylglucosamine transferase